MPENLFNLIEKYHNTKIWNSKQFVVEHLDKIANNKNNIKFKLLADECFEIFSAEEENKKRAKLKNIDKYSKKHRYYHYEQYAEGSGTAVFILFNPSNACPDFDDSTVKNCRKLTTDENLKNMIIINLFSERTTKPENFNKDYIEQNKINITFINEVLNKYKNESDAKLIKAWGFAKDNDYKSEIEKIDLGDNYYIIGIDTFKANKLNHHPSNSCWGSIGGFSMAKIMPYESIAYNISSINNVN